MESTHSSQDRAEGEHNSCVESAGVPDAWVPALNAFRALALAIEEFRVASAIHFEVAVTETMAMSYLAGMGAMTAGDLGHAMGLAPSSISAVWARPASAN